MMDDILIENLSAEEHQALVCMYYAKLPSSDPRSKKMKDDFAVLESFTHIEITEMLMTIFSIPTEEKVGNAKV